jgi:predicted acyl esterase
MWSGTKMWPPASTAGSYYLVSPKAGEFQGSLSSDARRDKKAFASFVSDPANPVVNSYSASGAHHYRDLAKSQDVMTFDSAPLEQDTEVSGPIRAQIYFACDCRDTDLWVRLLDVAPDGTAFNVMGPGLDVLRARATNPGSGGNACADRGELLDT